VGSGGGRQRAWRVWAFFIAVLALATAGLYAARGQVQQVHVVLVYLLIILGGSAYGGRALGIVLAVLGFLSIDYFFQTPFGLLSVGSGLDWFVLVAFLITAGVAANLLARAQASADRERGRSEEVARLSRLGAELLGSGRAEDALSAIAEKVRDAVGAETVTVFRTRNADQDPTLEPLVIRGQKEDGEAGGNHDSQEAVDAAKRGEAIAIGTDGRRRPLPVGTRGQAVFAMAGGAPARALFIPLRVHDRVVGVLAATRSTQLRVDPASLRFLDALSYYTAIAVERVTLVAEAEHAEALRESDRVREALLASISHDLRTPLSTIKVLAQDLAGPHYRSDGVATNAAIIEEQADRLSRLVTNLLDLTRLRTSAFPVNPEVNAAEDLIGAAARQVTGILGDHPLERRIDQTGPVLLGKFDFVQSQRILANLIENAVRFSPPGAPIILGVCREDDTLAFSVSDTGPGVPASERERIFEPFYRAPATVADVGGVGLGLYIGRALAEAQGGSLRYVSRREGGGGSTFVLRLPASEETTSDLEADLLE
jgi:two-component system sensor histidine kinase KdpD